MSRSARQAHIDRFYEMLADLNRRLGGPRRLASAAGSNGWPDYGVYFFFEDTEFRPDGQEHRVGDGKPIPAMTLWC